MATVDNNLLPSNTFKVLIGGTKEFPKMNYFAVGCTLPSVTNAETSTQFRNRPGYVPSETLVFDTLGIRFLCDEKMKVYDEIYNWMFGNTRGDFKTADITIQLFTSHNNITRSLVCETAFPTSLGSVEFDAQSTEITYPTLDVSFRYDTFNFVDN